MILDAAGIAPGDAVRRLDAEGAELDGAALASFIIDRRRPRRVFVDATASDDVPARYDELLQRGVAVVTANKRRLAGRLDAYQALRRAGWRRFFHETTVGAGLPVLRTLHELRATGDGLHRLTGLLSGTVGYLVDELSKGCRFSEAVRRAHELGYTEPQPLDDLSGEDVARKLVILAREAGFDLERGDVEVEPLVATDKWRELELEELWRRLAELDGAFEERQKKAERDGRRLCYLANLEGGRARVGLVAIPSTHPCATATGTENVIAFYTDRYRDMPLTVRGPGAGPDVTAAGVFADILRAAATSG